jgi:hypothetical protein
MTLFDQPRQSMSDTSESSHREQEFIEAMDRNMVEFVRANGFYPSQTIEITTSIGDRYVTYRVERGEIKPR